MATSPDRSAADWVRSASRRLALSGSRSRRRRAPGQDPWASPRAASIGISPTGQHCSRPVLADWEARATAPLLERLKRSGAEPADRLGALMAYRRGRGQGQPRPRHARLGATAMNGPPRPWAASMRHGSPISPASFAPSAFRPPRPGPGRRLLYLHLLGEHALAFGPADASVEERLGEAKRVLALLRGRSRSGPHPPSFAMGPSPACAGEGQCAAHSRLSRKAERVG